MAERVGLRPCGASWSRTTRWQPALGSVRFKLCRTNSCPWRDPTMLKLTRNGAYPDRPAARPARMRLAAGAGASELLIVARHFNGEDTNELLLGRDEKLFLCVTDTALVEERRGQRRYEGGSPGCRFPSAPSLGERPLPRRRQPRTTSGGRPNRRPSTAATHTSPTSGLSSAAAARPESACSRS